MSEAINTQLSISVLKSITHTFDVAVKLCVRRYVRLIIVCENNQCFIRIQKPKKWKINRGVKEESKVKKTLVV
jgi:hypothetical protein